MDARRYAAYKRLGLCPNCGDAAASDGVFCYGCRGRMRLANRKSGASVRYRARLAAVGRCMDCRAVKPDVCGRYPRCDACREAFAVRRKAERDARRRLGLCTECGREEGTGPIGGLGPHCSERHARSLAKQRDG